MYAIIFHCEVKCWAVTGIEPVLLTTKDIQEWLGHADIQTTAIYIFIWILSEKKTFRTL